MSKNAEIPLSESLEDYLEAIYCIIDERKVARPKDIISRLGVSGASVTGALRLLSEKKLIYYAPHDLVSFTETGAQIAAEVYRRHLRLRSFLTDILLVEPEQADAAACKMEHILSENIVGRLVRLTHFLQKSPKMTKIWQNELTGIESEPDEKDEK